jgi:prepilin-type N-terminal cleavage/methylation domain-containing protein
MDRRHPVTGKRRARRGMTLVEVIISLGILGSVMLSLGAYTARLSQSSSVARISETAIQLAADRMDTVRAATRYAAIESLYVASESHVAGFAQYERRTLVRHVGGAPTDTIDYRVVTVIVTHPALTSPVRRSTVIAPF